MCGIAGLWNGDDEQRVRQMLQRVGHRGPDASGVHHQPNRGWLGHQRLSIMDPTGGDQPLYDPDRKLTLVANGEIYNYPELRGDLAKRHQFQTGNDSEAVLYLFDEHGTGAAAHLDGMFAFALTDGDDLFLARDTVGIKPLYLGRTRGNGRLWFGSELKAFVGLGDVEVSEFPPGCWYHTKHGLQRFAELPRHEPGDAPAGVWAKRVREQLERAVVKRLMSDVPVGAFLSGGLDSTLICALARRHLPEMHTFSVGIEGSDDLAAARRASEYLDTIHHEYVYAADEVLSDLPQILYHLESFDQDLVRSAIPCWFCSRLAAQHVKVILTGEGADELFAGYAYYRGLATYPQLHEELHRSVAALHNINLQRVDRLTMAHGLEGRVPFLDLEMIDLALRIPAELKLPAGEPRIEKYILRLACEDLLPPELLWRDKAQFDEGSGTVDLVEQCVTERVQPAWADAWQTAHAADRLRSPEEAWYHSLLTNVYQGSRVVFDNVARWTDRDSKAAPDAACRDALELKGA